MVDEAKVIVVVDHEIVWTRETGRFVGGVSVQQKAKLQVVLSLLEEAIGQVRADLGGFNDVDTVANVCLSTAKVDHDVPVPAVWHDYSCRKVGEESTVVRVGSPVLV